MKISREALNEYRRAAWAVRPETLAAIAAVLRGELRSDQVAGEHVSADTAALRSQSRTTGGVAVIPLRGLITPRPSFMSLLFGGGGGLQSFRSSLADATASEDITSIIIDIDSPGGSTDLVAETAEEIRAARTVKPIVAVANTWAASAAYWLAAQADEVVVTPSGEVGSIGVWVPHEDWSKFDEDRGVKTTLISAGKYKTEGNMFEPLSDEARAAIQQIVDDFYALFIGAVAKGRGTNAAGVRNGYGEGRMVTAKRAVELGMADRVDSFEGTVARLVRKPPRSRSAEHSGGHPEGTAAGGTSENEGTPEPNATIPVAEEAEARPSEPYIDLMFGVPR